MVPLLIVIVLALIIGSALFSLLSWAIGGLIIGLLAGLIASAITKDYGQRGLIGNIILGWLGYIVSSVLLSLIGIGHIRHGFLFDGGLILNLILSTFGAVVLIWLGRAFTGRNRPSNYNNFYNNRNRY